MTMQNVTSAICSQCFVCINMRTHEEHLGTGSNQKEHTMLKKYVIERDVEGIGSLSASEMGGAAKTSNAALSQIKGIQWQHSYVTANKTFCIYLAQSEAEIRRHAELSGFPANKVTEVTEIIDPVTEKQCPMAMVSEMTGTD